MYSQAQQKNKHQGGIISLDVNLGGYYEIIKKEIYEK